MVVKLIGQSILSNDADAKVGRAARVEAEDVSPTNFVSANVDDGMFGFCRIL